LSQRQQGTVKIPSDIPKEDILFTAHKLIPDGKAEDIRYVIFVDPEKYHEVPDTVTKLEIGRAISRLNQKLADEPFILMGPGRWGSANLDLGVRVNYIDIHNTKVLIEVGVPQDGQIPELSYGTHFLQDLVEAGIHSLPLHLGDGISKFDWDFFRQSPNCLAQLSPDDAELADYLRVIDVPAVANNRRIKVVMDGEEDEAVAFLTHSQAVSKNGAGSVSNF
jgi:hypothetical protein